MNRTLDDVLVLDLTQVLAGPFAVTMLADFGANVIQIEPPKGDYTRHLFASQTVETRKLIDWSQRRNRRGMTLNLRSQKGRNIFLKLVEKADVVVQNFSSGTMERLDLSYDTMKEVNPGIIYCAMSGFGQIGPYKDMLAYDPIIQAASGIMSLTGFAENPPVRVGIQIGDIAGATYAVIGILLALHYRDVTGKGQMIDCAMFDALCHWTFVELFAGVNLTGKERLGNQHPVGLSNIYETQDGQCLILAILSDAEWERFLPLIGKEQLMSERWSAKTRLQRNEEIDRWIKDWVKSMTLSEACERLTQARIANHKVNRLLDLKTDPHVAARELLVEVNDPECGGSCQVRGLAPKLLETPGSVGTAEGIPKLGQHTNEILSELLGYSSNEVAILREEGIV